MFTPIIAIIIAMQPTGYTGPVPWLPSVELVRAWEAQAKHDMRLLEPFPDCPQCRECVWLLEIYHEMLFMHESRRAHGSAMTNANHVAQWGQADSTLAYYLEQILEAQDDHAYHTRQLEQLLGRQALWGGQFPVPLSWRHR